MKSLKTNRNSQPDSISNENKLNLNESITKAWEVIAPFWPLKNLIAVNPLQGFEGLPFEGALEKANAYFGQSDLPEEMQAINRESIKWLQVFFDEGQATIKMPQRSGSLLQSVRLLLPYDKNLFPNKSKKTKWLTNLPQDAEEVIGVCLRTMSIPANEYQLFLSLMLSTLPGWAANVRYQSHWAPASKDQKTSSNLEKEYLALRLIITCLLWEQAKDLLVWHKKAQKNADVSMTLNPVVKAERAYQDNLLSKFQFKKADQKRKSAKAQFVFCIDVRSEPFRRAIEARGDYETLGFAGFFGVAASIHNPVTKETYSSCPVLLKPAYEISQKPMGCVDSPLKGFERLQGIKKLYQSVKYTFTTPFSLVETLGIWSGVWMGLKSFFPETAYKLRLRLKKAFAADYTDVPQIDGIPLKDQVAIATSALKMMGLTKHFSPLVFLCGHGSSTQNNAYASSLDCGACGGNHGAPNAKILATILNKNDVRKELAKEKIVIPTDTTFLAAQHNTTTDDLEIFDQGLASEIINEISTVKADLEIAKAENSLWRVREMGVSALKENADKKTKLRSQDWAQVRPEWGLAKNAAFIVAPREITKEMNLEGRSFLHSYRWEEDKDSSSLTTILTAPMVVAQWINAQYFFSTLDNVSYGGGSKVTQNISGKFGVMQGNASDLMHGLSLQSVFKSDSEAYHQPLRLNVVVSAPKSKIDKIIKEQPVLQKLFGNGWVHLFCLDPQEKEKFALERNFTWAKL